MSSLQTIFIPSLRVSKLTLRPSMGVQDFNAVLVNKPMRAFDLRRRRASKLQGTENHLLFVQSREVFSPKAKYVGNGTVYSPRMQGFRERFNGSFSTCAFFLSSIGDQLASTAAMRAEMTVDESSLTKLSSFPS